MRIFLVIQNSLLQPSFTKISNVIFFSDAQGQINTIKRLDKLSTMRKDLDELLKMDLQN